MLVYAGGDEEIAPGAGVYTVQVALTHPTLLGRLIVGAVVSITQKAHAAELWRIWRRAVRDAPGCRRAYRRGLSDPGDGRRGHHACDGIAGGIFRDGRQGVCDSTESGAFRRRNQDGAVHADRELWQRQPGAELQRDSAYF